MNKSTLISKPALTVGFFAAALALSIAASILGFQLVFAPALIVSISTLFVALYQLDRFKPKHNSFIINWFFCVAFTWLVLAACTLAGSITNFILASMEFYFSEIFKFRLIISTSDNYSFQDFFMREGLSYLLAPSFWVLLVGLLPSLIFGTIYSIFRWHNAKTI